LQSIPAILEQTYTIFQQARGLVWIEDSVANEKKEDAMVYSKRVDLGCFIIGQDTSEKSKPGAQRLVYFVFG